MTANSTPPTQVDLLPYGIGALATAVFAADASLYVASRVIGDRPTPGSPTALLLALKATDYRLPTPVVVLASILFVVLLTAAVTLVMWWAGRRAIPKNSTRARWATRKDLAPLVVDKDPLSRSSRVGRIGLGQTDPGGQPLAAEPLHSVCVLGPSRSGKTLSVVIPALREWAGPAICTSVKPDVLEATEDQRVKIGPVFVYDPTNSTGRKSSTAKWNPLASCSTWPDAWEMASWLAVSYTHLRAHETVL